MKKVLVLIGATAFILSVTSFCLADNRPWRGNVTQICPDRVIVVEGDVGKHRAFIISGAVDLKFGDNVMVKDGTGKQRSIIKGGSKNTIEAIEIDTDADNKVYKDGEDGVNRTRPGNKACPSANPNPNQPHYKDVR
jgi:hypothetical protein